jgi:hypothetical protein
MSPVTGIKLYCGKAECTQRVQSKGSTHVWPGTEFSL